MEIEISTK